MPDPIPALTIWQPWATLIIEGLKPYEFRPWQAPRRFWGRRIAIHAGARAPKRAEVLDLIRRLETDDAEGQALDVPGSLALLRRVVNDLAALPLASVLGTAMLCVPLTPEQVRAQLGNDREGDYAHAWPLTEIRRLTPFVPAKGAQGFWPWTPPDA